MFWDEDRNPEVQNREGLEDQPVLLFILQLGKLRPREKCFPTSRGRVRDGTQIFKTERKGSGQWLSWEPPPLTSDSPNLPRGCTGVGIKLGHGVLLPSCGRLKAA